MRIVAGRWRRQWLDVADAPGLRPSPDALRETLFNWLLGRLNAPVLDAFAGTGALGFEAASRGAPTVYLLERSDVVIATLERNRARLLGDIASRSTLANAEAAANAVEQAPTDDSIPDLRVEAGDALAWLDARLTDALDAPLGGLLLDPPFRCGLIDAVVQRLPALEAAGVVSPRAWIYVEQEAEATPPSLPGRVLARERRHGETCGRLYLAAVE